MRVVVFGVIMAVGLAAFASVAQAERPSLEQYYNSSTAPVVPPAAKADVPAPETAPAPAERPAAGNHIVTSVKKCFEDIGPAAAAQIRRQSVTPYADCQRTLRQQAEQKAREKAAEAVPAPAETPRNFRRVTETPVVEKPAKPATPAPAARKPVRPNN